MISYNNDVDNDHDEDVNDDDDNARHSHDGVISDVDNISQCFIKDLFLGFLDLLHVYLAQSI